MVSPKVVEEIISQVAGKDVMPLVKLLKHKKNVSEFKLAESIRKEINLTRNMLYRLYDANLVSFIRKKDKKKGWYIYYWTLNQHRMKDLVKNLKKEKLERLKERYGREKTTQFYICPNKCIRLDFDQSTEFDFKCPECGELLNLEDNTKTLKNLEKEIATIKAELAAKDK